MEARRDVFQAIADPTRRAILTLLAVQALTPGAIAEKFHSSRQTISKHIRILTECNLLNQESNGREIFYQLNPKTMKEIYDWTEQFQLLWEGRFSAMDKLLKKMQATNSKIKNK